MKAFLCITLLLLLAESLAKSTENKETEKVVKKRQIYREQVLPHSGGKIPDTTFQTDRLLLNRLQKEGIAIPDGIILEQRNPQVHQYYNKASRPVFRVAVTSDGRYTPTEGQYIYRGVLPSLETTYLYPQVHNYPLRRPPTLPIIPRYKPLQFPSPQATDNLKHLATKAPKKVYLVSYEYAPSISSNVGGGANTIVNIENNPLDFGRATAPQHYITSHLLNDFDDFFSGFNLREIRSTEKKVSRTKGASIK